MSDEFEQKTTYQKWEHISLIMTAIAGAETAAFPMRRRLNSHHSSEQVKDEIRSFRLSQYQKWCKVKDLYAQYRDELSNTFDNESFKHCRNVLERIFTEELDEALRQTLEE